jgi:hypothetical protein
VLPWVPHYKVFYRARAEAVPYQRARLWALLKYFSRPTHHAGNSWMDVGSISPRPSLHASKSRSRVISELSRTIYVAKWLMRKFDKDAPRGAIYILRLCGKACHGYVGTQFFGPHFGGILNRSFFEVDGQRPASPT